MPTGQKDYDTLKKSLHKYVIGAPDTPNFDKILRLLFTPEEVVVAAHMTFSPKSAKELSTLCFKDIEITSHLCELMADKGVIFAKTNKGEKVYHLLPSMPGLIEFPFMGGENSKLKDSHDDLSMLWDQYAAEGFLSELSASPTTAARIIPTNQSVNAEKNMALPFDQVNKMLADVNLVGVGMCPCRQMKKNCDHDLETCFVFDDLARFLIDRKIVREVSREETLDIIARCEKKGLVHITNNAADKIGLLCNCCTCCCYFMSARVDMGYTDAFSTTRWIPDIHEDLCNGCGICAKTRCKFDALTIQDKLSVLNLEKCIGCGLCATSCPENAIEMILRPDPVPKVPKTATKRALAMAQEKNRLKDFIDVTKESKLAYYLVKVFLFFQKK